MKPDRDTAEPLESFLARIRAMSSAGYKRVASGESERAMRQLRRKGVQRRAKPSAHRVRAS